MVNGRKKWVKISKIEKMRGNKQEEEEEGKGKNERIQKNVK